MPISRPKFEPGALPPSPSPPPPTPYCKQTSHQNVLPGPEERSKNCIKVGAVPRTWAVDRLILLNFVGRKKKANLGQGRQVPKAASSNPSAINTVSGVGERKGEGTHRAQPRGCGPIRMPHQSLELDKPRKAPVLSGDRGSPDSPFVRHSRVGFLR